MKAFLLILLIFTFSLASSQDLEGKYKDYFGYSLELNSDSTFKFEWRFDLIYNWATGKWLTNDKVLTFNFLPVFDTLVRTGKSDSLVLSIDKVPNNTTKEQFLEYELISGGQDKDRFPTELKLKKGRLYHLDSNGKISRKRRSGIWPQKRWIFGNKKWPTYFRKIK